MKAACLFLVLTACAFAERVSLFDGKSLDGWEINPGEEKWWRVQDGAITGGSLEENIPHNTFLASKKRYANFDLRFRILLVKGEGFMNSGMQVRSKRDGTEMAGYQVDAGIGYWGDLYDEHRRNRKIAGAADPEALKAAVKDWDWNEYRILCEGPRIRSWINGVATLDFTETEPRIPLEGLLGIQTHGGGKVLVQVKDITIEELPATPGAPAWDDGGALPPERQKSSFRVPDGYEIELIASEEQGVGKPITVAWDHSGRMWTMTALEYPVDANENAAAAEALFQRGGTDRVLVFDEPWKPGPQTPRVFAEGLAIPLGLLPWKDGALVQYGHEIRYYEDRNKDGKADGHSTVLAGFGIQDSHLFPHQFERSPGGWFYLAQGLFNYSKVTRPDGAAFADGSKEKPFNHCKLARAKLDGSDFELLTAGPNNIWGLATARDGTEFLQEANDLGHPVSEFIAGTHYPTGSREKLRPYAPQLPESTPGVRLGGTGLSGLALAEDDGSPFAAKWPGEKVFYIVNPITNRIQIVTQRTDDHGHSVYTKRDDFLTSSDDWFRPVAAHFGPDGCLYIVDWYNKIISHNEVPRNHPERDKTRGRIWRVKPAGMEIRRPPDLTCLSSQEIAGLLGGPNARVARMAWAELGDRRDKDVVPSLRTLATNETSPVPARLGALWALQEMGEAKADLLAKLARDPDANLRREALDAAGDPPLSSVDFLALVSREESDFQVLCALTNALRRQMEATPAMAAAVVRHAGAPAEGSDRAAYERNFLRYLIRWALETHPAAAAALAGGEEDLPVEPRLLATLALAPERGAPKLLDLLPEMDRPLAAGEIALLGAQLASPEVAGSFGALLGDPARREGVLRALLQLDPSAAVDPVLRRTTGQATRRLLAEKPDALPLALDLVRRFQLLDLAPVIVAEARKPRPPGELAVLLRALNEIRAADAELCFSLLDHADPAVVREAFAGYAAAGGPAAVRVLAERWPELPGVLRQFVLDGMLSRRPSAEAFARLAAAGGFAGFDPSAVEKLSAVLGPEDPAFRAMLEKVSGLLMRALRLPGADDAIIATGFDLAGPFTVETWILLGEDVDNRDSLLGNRDERMDLNFYQSRLRLYAGSDIVIADRAVKAGEWTHCAVTRDPSGRVALHLDGEPAGAADAAFTEPLRKLDLGRANAAGGTAARFIEFRIWDRARSEAEIRADHRTVFTDGAPGLVHRYPGESAGLPVKGGAALEWTADFPELITPEAAKALEEKFDRFRKMASNPGDPEAGKTLFQATCLICHQVRGEGIAIGPDLSGAGAMGVESLLRNVLTPNAQLESGYYRHDVTLVDGGFVSGFLASQDEKTLILRQIGADERAIPKDQVKEHSVSKRSLMPEGLIDGYTGKQVADLFAYLAELK